MYPVSLPLGMRGHTLGKVIITEGQHGVMLKNGAFRAVLDPGKYRIWPFSGVRIVVVDTRRTSLQMTNQKLLTADNVAVTLSIVAQYRMADPRKAVLAIDSFQNQLYLDVQLAARNSIAARSLDEVLNDRGGIGEELLGAVVPLAAEYGIAVEAVGLKDIVFSPHVRNLLMKEVETKRLAQAALNSAREEAAAMRSLLNTARLIEAHPGLLRLRELEVARAAVQTGGNTLVIGVPQTVIPTGSATPRAPEDEEIGDEG